MLHMSDEISDVCPECGHHSTFGNIGWFERILRVRPGAEHCVEQVEGVSGWGGELCLCNHPYHTTGGRRIALRLS